MMSRTRATVFTIFSMIAALTLCAALAVLPAGAQEKVTLKQNVKPNEPWDVSMTMGMNMKLKVGQPGQEQNVDQEMTLTIAGKQTPLEVKDGAPTKLKMDFSPDCKMHMQMAGQTQQVPLPFAGKSVTITKNDDGSVSVEPAGIVDAQTNDTLKNLLEASSRYYPDHPVAVGDTWEVIGTAAAKAFDLGPDTKGSIKCTLQKIGTQDGRRTAEVALKGNVAGAKQGMQITVDMSGPMVVDVESGQPLSSVMDATMSMQGSPAGQSVPMTGTGTVHVTQTTSPSK